MIHGTEQSAVCPLASLTDSMRTLRQGEESSTEQVLGGLTRVALKSIPAADYAGITLARRDGSVETAWASHPYAAVLDEIQGSVGEGPALSAGWRHRIIRVDDLACDERWPLFRADALARTSVRSLLGLQLTVEKRSMAALNFAADRPTAFDDDDVEVGLMYAAHVSLALLMHQRDQQFRSALESRDLIGQAKGMIMERYGVDAVQAFELLKRLSQTSNVPVAEVAHGIIKAGAG